MEEILYTDINIGLNEKEVETRIKNKQVNKTKKVVGKSYFAIFTSNIFTIFNFIGILIFAIMLAIDSVSNSFFFVVILANTVIGIFQEIRSKLAIEKLSIVSEPTASVMRSGKRVEIATQDVVLDDVMFVKSGNQICADCLITTGKVEVDESMLTGESLPVEKRIGDKLFSGSYVVSGKASCQVIHVGKDNYIEELSAKVKKTKAPNSEVMNSIKAIIKVLGCIIFPFGIATFLTSTGFKEALEMGDMWNKYFAGNTFVVEKINESIASASGSMIGMIPSGMVLLLAVSFAVGALKLASKKVLVRELPCIEMLARVDTLCLDKTGTITDGTMTVEEVVDFDSKYNTKLLAYSVVSATGDSNVTAQAILNANKDVSPLSCNKNLPFSSLRKYSAAQIDGIGTVALGASEFMFEQTTKTFERKCNEYLAKGLRVLAVGVSNKPIKDGTVDDLKPVGIVVLSDTVRSDAPEIIRWFKENSVAVKIISGDNPLSVSVIAGKVGVENADKYISLEGMTDDEVMNVANKYTVFGRVTPEQKALLVKAMKQSGKTVAMTGDGVNDILAMRESDCAVTVGSGTDAAKTAAHIVLADNKFSSMPSVVAEGRQVVNNVQNSSTLFLMKTSMTVLVTLLLLFLPYSYPFQPMHLYSIEFGITGIATFMLTFKPNRQLIKGHFISNVLRRMIPSGIAMALSVILIYVFKDNIGITTNEELTTVAVLCSTFTGLCALWVLLVPLDGYNILVGVLSTALVFGILFGYQWVNQTLINDGSVYLTSLPKSAMIFVAVEVACMLVIIIVGKVISSNKKYKKAGI